MICLLAVLKLRIITRVWNENSSKKLSCNVKKYFKIEIILYYNILVWMLPCNLNQSRYLFKKNVSQSSDNFVMSSSNKFSCFATLRSLRLNIQTHTRTRWVLIYWWKMHENRRFIISFKKEDLPFHFIGLAHFTLLIASHNYWSHRCYFMSWNEWRIFVRIYFSFHCLCFSNIINDAMQSLFYFFLSWEIII